MMCFPFDLPDPTPEAIACAAAAKVLARQFRARWRDAERTPRFRTAMRCRDAVGHEIEAAVKPIRWLAITELLADPHPGIQAWAVQALMRFPTNDADANDHADEGPDTVTPST
jgi:hypothetical protein